MDIRTENQEFVIIQGVLSKKLSNKRVETNLPMEHAVPYDTLTTAPTMPIEGEWCELDYLYDYQGTNFNCIQAHNRTEHSPFDTPALWRQYRGQGLEWVQPISTNPYQLNDWVTHNGENWISLINNNVWEPDVVGSENLWELKIEEI